VQNTFVGSIGEARSSLHSGIHAQPDHQLFACEHIDGAAAKRPRSERLWEFPLAVSHLTLAETLKKRGAIGPRHLSAPSFWTARRSLPVLIAGSSSTTIFPRKVKPSRAGDEWSAGGWKSCNTRRRWLNAHPAGPHFVWVHLYDPHDPYEPPPPYSEIYKDRASTTEKLPTRIRRWVTSLLT